jgi:hypothetical protein
MVDVAYTLRVLMNLTILITVKFLIRIELLNINTSNQDNYLHLMCLLIIVTTKYLVNTARHIIK